MMPPSSNPTTSSTNRAPLHHPRPNLLAASWPVAASTASRARLATTTTTRRTRRSATTTRASAAVPTTPPPPLTKGRVLIAPAFYLDAAVFRPLAAELRSRGFDAALAPIRWYHWTPTLGGRSQRPILDRLDWALEDLCGGSGDGNGGDGGNDNANTNTNSIRPAPVDPVTLELPARGPYGPLEFLQEMRDPSLGARPLGAVAPIPQTPLPPSQRAAVVASSAAGWISRILLAGDRAGEPYCGRLYEGAAQRCRALVTLGTPHYSSEPVTRRNIDWVNTNCPGSLRSPEIKYVAVGAVGVSGKELIPGSNFGDFAWESYKLCAGDGKVDGDGVTPLQCALALEGAELVRLEGCAHNPPLFGAAKKADWYGEGGFLEAWVGFLDAPLKP